MDSKRIKEIQEQTAYPESITVYLALNQVWNECEQENNKNIEALTKQRDELIDCLKLAYEYLSGNTEEKVFSKIEELLTKTRHNE